MIFIYPAVLSEKEDGRYQAYFPDLESCTAEGFDLNDTLDRANEAARDWIALELDDPDGVLPYVSDEEDIPLKDGEFIRNISVNYKFYEGWDE